jgi:hypothetical protein
MRCVYWVEVHLAPCTSVSIDWVSGNGFNMYLPFLSLSLDGCVYALKRSHKPVIGSADE